jgi:hypothetical protein
MNELLIARFLQFITVAPLFQGIISLSILSSPVFTHRKAISAALSGQV